MASRDSKRQTKRGRFNRRWSDMSRGQRVVTTVLGTVQLSLAVAAWVDLARRPPEQVDGPKSRWAAIIGINWIGPVVYFMRGRKTASSVLPSSH